MSSDIYLYIVKKEGKKTILVDSKIERSTSERYIWPLLIKPNKDHPGDNFRDKIEKLSEHTINFEFIDKAADFPEGI